MYCTIRPKPNQSEQTAKLSSNVVVLFYSNRLYILLPFYKEYKYKILYLMFHLQSNQFERAHKRNVATTKMLRHHFIITIVQILKIPQQQKLNNIYSN